MVASQYLGRKDEKNAQLSAAQLFSVLIMLTVSFGLLCILLCRLILRTVFGSIEAHVMHYAEIYFYISAVSYPLSVFIMPVPHFSALRETVRSA